MTVRVLFFAHLREVAGEAEMAIELPPGSTLHALREVLAAGRPGLAPELSRLPVVVNGEPAAADVPLADQDEVAWIPPVAGGAAPRAGAVVAVRLVSEPIEPAALISTVAAPWTGAVALFLGTVRDHEGERAVERLEYQAYESLARARFAALAEEALARWPEARIAVSHRLGELGLGEVSVAVAVASPHRAEAFECCRHLIERIKRAVPIWKRSRGPEGADWVKGLPYEGDP